MSMTTTAPTDLALASTSPLAAITSPTLMSVDLMGVGGVARSLSPPSLPPCAAALRRRLFMMRVLALK